VDSAAGGTSPTWFTRGARSGCNNGDNGVEARSLAVGRSPLLRRRPDRREEGRWGGASGPTYRVRQK